VLNGGEEVSSLLSGGLLLNLGRQGGTLLEYVS